jgi:D-alanyl-D-alanine carboxypeptidase/D-alanyl-D-alanine-endopeptidase (penicillin-binding protein 4)
MFLLAMLVYAGNSISAQTVAANLSKMWAAFEADPQLRTAIASLYVVDAETGSVVFDKNSRIGLAPASTQKIITAATAYEILGKSFQYKTTFGYSGGIKSGRLSGGIVVLPSGDPTLGSWRWKRTAEEAAVKRIAASVAQAGIQSFDNFIVDARGWESENIPGGWIWDDVGNYYGAGAATLNWRENQYDLLLKSSADTGTLVNVVGTQPQLYGFDIFSKATAGPKGSGDNAYIYLPVGSSTGVVRGTIPAGESRFVISGAMPSAQKQFLATLTDTLSRRGIGKEFPDSTMDRFSTPKTPATVRVFHTEVSPPLDSISYWFLKRSINLYGEALIKTIAVKQGKTASTGNGADGLQTFWVDKNIGIDKAELHVYDGSGLSPLNRTTTHAQVAILQYAKKQAWYRGYLSGFPEFNGMVLKSGTISRVKSFCGYHSSKAGNQYIISFIVNNYNGASAAVVQKMYRVLDVLK